MSRVLGKQQMKNKRNHKRYDFGLFLIQKFQIVYNFNQRNIREVNFFFNKLSKVEFREINRFNFRERKKWNSQNLGMLLLLKYTVNFH